MIQVAYSILFSVEFVTVFIFDGNNDEQVNQKWFNAGWFSLDGFQNRLYVSRLKLFYRMKLNRLL